MWKGWVLDHPCHILTPGDLYVSGSSMVHPFQASPAQIKALMIKHMVSE
jgi:hypothetical protein